MDPSTQSTRLFNAIRQGKAQSPSLYSDVPESFLNILTKKNVEILEAQKAIEQNLLRADTLISRINQHRATMNSGVMKEISQEEVTAAATALTEVAGPGGSTGNMLDRVAGELPFGDVQLAKPGKTTLLHEMVSLGLLEEVRKILAVTADKNPRDLSGSTPVHVAAQEGHEAILIELVGGGASVSARDCQGKTPLHRAIEFGHSFLIDVLVRLGSDLNERDARGRSSLHLAAEQASTMQLEALLSSEDIELSPLDSRGRTPLHAAVERGNEAAVLMFLARGAPLNEVGPGGVTPMMLAAHPDRLRCLKVLAKAAVQSGANFDVKDHMGRDALSYAVIRCCTEAVAVLTEESGRSVRAGLVSEAGSGARAHLHTAAALGNQDVVSALIHKGRADPNVRDELGVTPLHLAAAGGHLGAIGVLIRAGARKEARTEASLETPLHYAVRHDAGDAVELLIGLGCDTNARCVGDRTPLMQCVMQSSRTAQQTASISPGSVKKDSIVIGFTDDTEKHTAVGVVALGNEESDQVGEVARLAKAKTGLEEERPTALKSLLKALPSPAVLSQLTTEIGGRQPEWPARFVQMAALDAKGDSALHLAVRFGELPVIKALCKAGANASWINKSGDSCVSLGVDRGDTRIIRLLIQVCDESPDNMHDSRGFTPIQRAAARGNVSMVAALSSLGAKNEHTHPVLGTHMLAKHFKHTQLENASIKKPPPALLYFTARVILKGGAPPQPTMKVVVSPLIAAVSPKVSSLRVVVGPLHSHPIVIAATEASEKENRPTSSLLLESMLLDAFTAEWDLLVPTKYPPCLVVERKDPHLHVPIPEYSELPVRITAGLLPHFPAALGVRAVPFSPATSAGAPGSPSRSLNSAEEFDEHHSTATTEQVGTSSTTHYPKTENQLAISVTRSASKWSVNKEALEFNFNVSFQDEDSAKVTTPPSAPSPRQQRGKDASQTDGPRSQPSSPTKVLLSPKAISSDTNMLGGSASGSPAPSISTPLGQAVWSNMIVESAPESCLSTTDRANSLSLRRGGFYLVRLHAANEAGSTWSQVMLMRAEPSQTEESNDAS